MNTKSSALMLSLLLGWPGTLVWANPEHRPNLRAMLKAQQAWEQPAADRKGAHPSITPVADEKRLSPQERAELREQLRRNSAGTVVKNIPPP